MFSTTEKVVSFHKNSTITLYCHIPYVRTYVFRCHVTSESEINQVLVHRRVMVLATVCFM